MAVKRQIADLEGEMAESVHIDLDGPVLLGVELGEWEMSFNFSEFRVRFFKPLHLRPGDQADDVFQIDPAARIGNLEMAWHFVGKEAAYYAYGDARFELVFRDGSSARCEKVSEGLHVIFMGGPLEGGLEHFEYPEIMRLIVLEKASQ
jgi:hypothetical protein